ncbi:Zn(II)2Cys6 transcription factor [Aspergillus clavatus NRRL 1]|uniref:C6 finger domain protein Acr-2, putative n=1 Tax=Aspergillus clavatus (strain ATCC 1007 / CBS 513.65 / DSM 816 / NCTC 3887 / NRRL 1 / QM 1276 / 107) TaxID=344612 RepID=A1CL09_ASPCL|nr:C6 finger domain protein Acr-2, putative [Aspergillus clavatus NRRL 1]EAW09833.1 C6 finger domain protein Acr-2, putative [Aspergillus clavatus NRRL 1]
MNKGCYTCRRRRIICDNGLPTCRKCRNAGKECLGYQKPLVWVKGGVASRGKMMGRSFDDIRSNSTVGRVDAHHPKTSLADSAMLPSAAGTFSQFGIEKSVTVSPDETSSILHDQSMVESTGTTTGCLASSIQHNPAPAEYVPTPRVLVDPLFKDLSPLSRFYLSHFNQHLVNYLALYSNVRNPYRDLTSLVGESRVLTHALAATGALHYAILTNPELSLPWSSDAMEEAGTALSSEEMERSVINSMAKRPSSQVYEQFLGFKQHALRQLSLDLCDPVMRNDNRTLAAIMVLALMDAIESGGGAWKYHLEGAKKLLKHREQSKAPTQTQGMMDWLDTFAIDGCLLIQLMGSTLARPGSLTQPFYTSSMGSAVLKRLEETSWVGCPAYLLEVIFFVQADRFAEPDTGLNAHPNNMSFSSAFLPSESNPLRSPDALLHHIQVFDPVAWAEAMQTCLYLDDLSMRIALATIYKAAVYLYASRVLSRPRSDPTSPTAHPFSTAFHLPQDHAAVTNILIRQIALIPVADPHFKCLIWPTFIAGAECRDPAHRPFLLGKLRSLYYDITSVNVRNAAWVLSLMWRKRDHRRQERNRRRAELDELMDESPRSPLTTDYDDDDFDWIQELDDSRVDWLFI